jgi:hypothetical protein
MSTILVRLAILAAFALVGLPLLPVLAVAYLLYGVAGIERVVDFLFLTVEWSLNGIEIRINRWGRHTVHFRRP